jgi:hypothetical protein
VTYTPVGDHTQDCLAACSEILNTLAAMITLTGKSDGSVVPWEVAMVGAPPIAAVQHLVTTRYGGSGDTRLVSLQFSCVGRDDAEAHRLAALIERSLTVMRFAALSPPLNAGRFPSAQALRRGGQREAKNRLRVDTDISFLVTI